jgi:hypothetical protein
MKEFIEKMTANRYFDISKARTKLGFEPVVDYQEVAKEMAIEYSKIVKEKARGQFLTEPKLVDEDWVTPIYLKTEKATTRNQSKERYQSNK